MPCKGKSEMRSTWTYNFGQNIISIEKKRNKSHNTGQLITGEI